MKPAHCGDSGAARGGMIASAATTSTANRPGRKATNAKPRNVGRLPCPRWGL
jgi:hypothetical protein